MSTRSNIGIINPDGTATFVYCHFDGYPSHNGKILLNNYTTEDAARELISFGDMSSLNKRAVPSGAHSYNKPDGETTVYYGRDRGEDGTEPQTADGRDGTAHNEYAYLWDPTVGGWIWTKVYGGLNWQPLTPAAWEGEDE